MTYVSWAAMYEGASDKAYFDVMLPRLMEDLTLKYGTRNCIIPPGPAIVFRRGTIETVAGEVCRAREAFQIFFVHADAGGRNLQASIAQRSCAFCEAIHRACDFALVRCVVIVPRHETEAWVLSDPAAVTEALGFNGAAAVLGLPETAQTAERITDPKTTIETAVRSVRGKRRTTNVAQLYSAIAQRQSFDKLRQANSFAEFEQALGRALEDLGCLQMPR